MKSKLYTLILFVIFFSKNTFSEDKQKIYVWNFVSENIPNQNLAKQITDEFEIKLISTGKYIVLQRRDYAKLFEQNQNEKAIQDLKDLSTGTKQQLTAEKAEIVVLGKLSASSSGNYQFTVLFQNISTSQIEKANTNYYSPSDFNIDPKRIEIISNFVCDFVIGPRAPLNIESNFVPCGFIGDIQNITYIPDCQYSPHSDPTSIKISYIRGPLRWAGIYLLNDSCNWGIRNGYNLSSNRLTKITFWAKGENGGESVQFKAGGVGWRGPQTSFKDSFDYEPKLSVRLDTIWQQFTLDLTGKDLSNVIGGFYWGANSTVTIYLDDLFYE